MGARPPAFKPSRDKSPRSRARTVISSSRQWVDETALAYVFDRDGFYEKLADRLLDRLPLRRKIARGHWLCVRLNGLARAVDPGTYTALLGKTTAQGLAHLGAQAFMAEVLGAGAGLGLKITMGSTPISQLTTSLRSLIPLVCPDLQACPTRSDVMKVFGTPLLAEQLKATASGTSVRGS
jgi:hypothetical protein